MTTRKVGTSRLSRKAADSGIRYFKENNMINHTTTPKRMMLGINTAESGGNFLEYVLGIVISLSKQVFYEIDLNNKYVGFQKFKITFLKLTIKLIILL